MIAIIMLSSFLIAYTLVGIIMYVKNKRDDI